MTYIYDGTYEGLLSVIFERYRLKSNVSRIVAEELYQEELFDHPVQVATNPEWAARVEKGIIRKTSNQSAKMLYRCFLSELPGVEWRIYQYIRLAMESSQNIEQNFREDCVLQLQQINKKVGREVHRMHAFVRFQHTKDNIYYAVIEPDLTLFL